MTIEVHQALFGYSGGHRLLTASERLPREAERALLILTDISGPVTGGAFESYLTASGVPGLGAYALARTWLAPEFNRPGCVWSHALLIDPADLARLPDLRALLPLFVRPRKGEPWQAYGRRLAVPETAPADVAGGRAWSGADARRIVMALYGAAPDVPTFVVADRPEVAEELVVALWSQQWPRLRRAFRFCTWSLGPRSIDGAPFDLQVVSPGVSRQLSRATAQVVALASRSGEAGAPEIPAWAREAAVDLGSAGALRRFLWAYGDATVGRPAFAWLAEVAGCVGLARERRLSVTELLESVTSRWPASGDMRGLKAALFGEAATRESGLLSAIGEADLLRAVGISPRHAALDRDALGLRSRAAALWRCEPGPALQLAGQLVTAGPASPLGEDVLCGIADALGPAEGLTLRARHPAILAALARRNPALEGAAPPPAAPARPSPPAASAAPKAQAPIPDTGTAGTPAPPARPQPLVAVESLVPRPSAQVAAILDRLDRSDVPADPGMLDAPQRRLLEARPSDVAAWLAGAAAPAPRTVAFVASMLDPHAPTLHALGAAPWLRATADIDGKLEPKAWLRLAAFLLALGFENAGPRAEELVAGVFETVDRAAAARELPLESWRALASRLPDVPRWRDADWSDRLRRGLVERFIQHGWAPGQLARAARDDAAFRRVVMICEWSDEGVRLLKRLAGEVARGGVDATKAQRALLARYA